MAAVQHVCCLRAECVACQGKQPTPRATVCVGRVLVALTLWARVL